MDSLEDEIVSVLYLAREVSGHYSFAALGRGSTTSSSVQNPSPEGE